MHQKERDTMDFFYMAYYMCKQDNTLIANILFHTAQASQVLPCNTCHEDTQ